MAVCFGGSCNVFDNICRIASDFRLKIFLFGSSAGNVGKLLLPLCRQLRRSQAAGRQLQHLSALRGQMDILISLFQHKAVKQFFNNIGPGGHCSQTSRFSQCLFQAFVCAFHIFHRIFHGGKQSSLGKRQRRLCFSFADAPLSKQNFLPSGKFRHLL
ncbi:hypothetical protein IMSAGC013_04080 [Lachnospiraceae bacterium]|nr:hypothetical protein IMSAGC013_04080 [Lachnospiraceae bacterium]